MSVSYVRERGKASLCMSLGLGISVCLRIVRGEEKGSF